MHVLLLAMSDDSSKGSPETEKRKEEGEEQGEGIQESGEEPKETLTCELQPERQPQAELEDGDREAEIQGGDQRREEREVRKEEKDPGTSAQAKREERMKRLRELHLRRVSTKGHKGAVYVTHTPHHHRNESKMNNAWLSISPPLSTLFPSSLLPPTLPPLSLLRMRPAS